MARARNIQGSHQTAIPGDEQKGEPGLGEIIQADFTDETPQEAFAIFLGGGGGEPKGRQILGELADGGLVGGAKGLDVLGLEILPELVDLALGEQFFFPEMLQLGGDQAIIGVDAFVATEGQIDFVAGLLETQSPLAGQGLVVGFDLLDGSQGGFQTGRLDGFEHQLGDGPVNRDQVEGLAAGAANSRVSRSQT